MGEAGIAFWDPQNEEYVVNPTATEEWVVNNAVGQNLTVGYSTVQGALEAAGIYDTVNGIQEVALLADVSGITASYSAATETLILNIPNPSA